MDAPHSGVDVVVEQLLPWGLRDFFVMDADEATDFVGGSENKVMNSRDVIDKTTSAVHSLLGIDVFRNASKRVAKSAREFGSQATKAVGDDDLTLYRRNLTFSERRSQFLEAKISISDPKGLN